MKKLLVTLRHPGPADAICSVLPELIERYNVIFVLTDSAIEFVKNKYKEYFNKIKIYIPDTKLEKGFIEYNNITKSCRCEFEEYEIENLNILYLNLKKLIKDINPDIALRTTPALKWGIDELLPRVMKELERYEGLKCYQEYYGSGRALNDGENEIANIGCNSLATVDEIAKNMNEYKEKRIINVGWMNQGQFLNYNNYNEARKLFRTRNNIQNEFCILYCTIATGQIKKEIQHYKLFLNSIKKSNNFKKTFCKFHPRNTESEIKQYIELTNKMKMQVEFLYKENYEEILAFSDILVSATSAVNIDCMEYQVLKANEINTICIYTIGRLTSSFFQKAIGKNTLPTHKEGTGNLIVDESTYDDIFDKIQNNIINCDYLYNEARKIYKKDFNNVKTNFISYLENNI